MKNFIYVFAITVPLMILIISCKTKITEVQLNKTELTLKIGETGSLVAMVLPEDASNKAVSWNSSNSTVVEVDNNGKITAKAVGIAIITVTTTDDNKTANCTVTVIYAEKIEPYEGLEMVFVEGGTFYSSTQKTASSFYIAKYLVTQKLWKDVMGVSPQLDYGEGDNYPIYLVNYFDILNFIGKLNSVTGKDFRLATSSEWEYAAKGGIKSRGYKYSGSNNIDDVAWYNGNSNNSTHPVGKKLPNELGIYDMSGNVSEWVSYYPLKTHPEEAYGGNWNSDAQGCHVSSSITADNICRAYDIGFRLVLPISNNE